MPPHVIPFTPPNFTGYERRSEPIKRGCKVSYNESPFGFSSLLLPDSACGRPRGIAQAAPARGIPYFAGAISAFISKRLRSVFLVEACYTPLLKDRPVLNSLRRDSTTCFTDSTADGRIL